MDLTFFSKKKKTPIEEPNTQRLIEKRVYKCMMWELAQKK
jgi:hypothetical protein